MLLQTSGVLCWLNKKANSNTHINQKMGHAYNFHRAIHDVF